MCCLLLGCSGSNITDVFVVLNATAPIPISSVNFIAILVVVVVVVVVRWYDEERCPTPDSRSLMAVSGDILMQPPTPPGLQIERGEVGQPRLRYALIEYWRNLIFVLRNAVPCFMNVSYQLVMLRVLELTW